MLMAAAPRPASATLEFKITPKFSGVFDLTWTKSTTTATGVIHDVFVVFGNKSLPLDTPNPGDYLSGNLVQGGFTIMQSSLTTTDKTAFTGLVLGPGSFCARVREIRKDGSQIANDAINDWIDYSPTICYDHIHNILRGDGAGGQIGFNQLWNIDYQLASDSHFSFKIFAPGTVFYSDQYTGFSTTTAIGTLVKVVASSVPRSGELADGSFINRDFWDTRYSTGGVVPNGIYFVLLQSEDPLLTPTWRDSALLTIPVDVIRFTRFDTVGITPLASVALINYTITGDASVRIVIGKRGRQYILNGNGDTVPICPAGATNCTVDPTGPASTDISTNSIVQIINFNRKAGTYSESWNGTDSFGVAVSSDIYTVSISAKDGFNNIALDVNGNQGAIQTTVPVDRTASQVAGDVTAPEISAMTVNGTSLGASSGANFVPTNPAVSGPFTQVVITLNETPGSGVNASSITVTGPQGVVFASTGVAGNVITWTSTASVSLAGAYAVSMILRDSTGNQYIPNPVPGFTIAASGSSGGSGGVAAQTAEQFRNSVSAYPNPARSAPARIAFTLAVTSSVDLDVYTVLGERVYHETKTFAAGANTFDWSMVNNTNGRIGSGIYLVRITAHDGTKSVTAMRKLMVIR